MHFLKHNKEIPLSGILGIAALFFLSIAYHADADTTAVADSIVLVKTEEKPASVVKENNDDLLIEDDSEEQIINEKTQQVDLPSKKTPGTEQKTTNALAQPGQGSLDSTAKTSSVNADTSAAKTSQPVAPVQEGAISEIGVPLQNDSTKKAGVAVSDSVKKRPVIVEKERAINFAKNLKEYRSPKKAMLMSLILPGLGQAYAKKYWKTAMFGIFEAAFIGFAVKYSRDANNQLESARSYADTYFRFSNFLDYYRNFKKFAEDTANHVNKKDSTTITNLFGDSTSMNDYINKFSNTVPHTAGGVREEFDNFIDGSNPVAVQGWLDCEPVFGDTGFVFQNANGNDIVFSYYNYSLYKAKQPQAKDDTLWLLTIKDKNGAVVASAVHGYSAYQLEYERQQGIVKRYDDYSRIFIMLLVVNHVASAVDAFISTVGYNKRLLNKQSIWQRINIDQDVAFTQQGDIRSSIGFTYRF